MDNGQNHSRNHKRLRGLLNFSFCREERGSQFLRQLDYYAGIPLSFLTSFYRRFFKRSVPQKILPDFKIGILCMGAIGDMLLLSGLLAAIKHKFPLAVITLVCSEANAGALALMPWADIQAAFPIKRPDKLLKYLRTQKMDILIDASPWARYGNIVCNLSKAGLTVGFRTPGQYRSLGYDKITVHKSDCHEAENFLALGKMLWPDLRGQPFLPVMPSPVMPSPVRTQKTKKTIFCHMWPAPGRGRHLKRWPEEYWAALIEILRKKYSVSLTGSARDKAANDLFLQKYFFGADNVFSTAGELSLAALKDRLIAADAMISVNTGIMHLAALLGVPTIGLHGATNPIRWGPVGERCVSLAPREGHYAYLNLGFEYPPRARNAMENLPVADVLVALAKFIII